MNKEVTKLAGTYVLALTEVDSPGRSLILRIDGSSFKMNGYFNYDATNIFSDERM